MPEDKIVETLIEEALRLAEQLADEGVGSGPVSVDVR